MGLFVLSKTHLIQVQFASIVGLFAPFVALITCVFVTQFPTPLIAQESLDRDDETTERTSFRDVQVLSKGPFRLRSIAGVVVDEQDEPVESAVVILRERTRSRQGDIPQWPVPTADLAIVRTGDDGFFEFINVPVPDDDIRLDIVSHAPAYGLAWWHIPHEEPNPRNTLYLQPESPVRGQMLDSRGNPVRGVTVAVTHVMPISQLQSADLDHGEWPSDVDEDYVVVDGTDHGPKVVFADDGSFTVHNLPHNVGAILRVEHADYAITSMYVATADSMPSGDKNRIRRDVQGRGGRFVLERAHRIRLNVVFDDTGLPVSEARVPNIEAGYAGPPQFTLGADGKFVVEHLTKSPVSVTVYPPVNSNYLTAMERVTLVDGEYEIDHTIRLVKGTVVSGQVVDALSGTGIHNVPILSLGAANRQSETRFDLSEENALTDTEGNFQLTVVPGTKQIAVHGYVAGYRTPQGSGEISRLISADISEDRTSGIVIKLDPAPKVYGRVYAPSGEPVAGVVVSTEVFDGVGSFPVKVATDDQGKYRLDRIYAPIRTDDNTEPLPIEFWNRERTLAHILQIPPWREPPPADQEFDIVLSPLSRVEGRVVDAVSSEPVAGMQIRLRRNGPAPHSVIYCANATSDEEGRFSIFGVIEGTDHVLEFNDQKRIRNVINRPIEFLGRAGDDEDLGDIPVHSPISP